jgi:hypothetical protein
LTNRLIVDVGRRGPWWKRPAVRPVIRLAWKLWPLSLLGSPSPAAAQPAANLSLIWDAPADCPTRDEIHSRVDGLLGGDASANTVADVQAAGQVERVPSGFRLKLSLAAGTRPTVREFEARTCDELAGAAAIAIALLARSGSPSADATGSADASTTSAPRENSTPRADATPGPAPRAKPDSTPNPENSDDAARAARLHLLVDAPLGVVGWGSLPSMGIGVGAAVGIRWKALRIVAGGELWRAQTLEHSGFGVKFKLQSARAEACLTQDVSGVEIGPCAGVALERLSAQGVASRTFNARSSTTLWVSASGGIMAAVAVPGFPALRLLGQASVRVPTRRPRFVIDQLGPVFQPALAAPKLDFGCGWIF